MPKIPLAPGFGEEKILASSFEAGLFPLSSLTESKDLYERFRKEHPKADHYPYAYCFQGNVKSSDDGEPGGSAGVPLASILKDNDIEGMVVVARFFGGTKLGIPRLRRAFLSAAEKAIDHARLGETRQRYTYSLEVDYSAYETLKKYADRLSFSINDVDFGMKVRLKIYSSDRLDGLGEKVGLFDLALPEPELETVLEEIEL